MLFSDVRFALRSLRANPGFTAAVLASLILGIGVNTALFSLVDQLLLWSIPAKAPNELVVLKGGRGGSFPFYREYRDQNQVFTSMFASSYPANVGVRPEGAPSVELGHVSYVSGKYFETLGIDAALGRLIVAEDDTHPGASPVVVLSYNYWQNRFGGEPGILGKKLAVNGYPLEIAGVCAKGFTGLFQQQQTDAFIPLTMYPITTPASAGLWNTPSMHWLSPMGRLKPGVSMQQAQAAMRVLWPRAVEAVNDAVVKGGGKRRAYSKEEVIALVSGAHGAQGASTEMTDPLRMLMIATALVLLIACANAANLMLARALGRRREIAVRMALGASRGRLVRQLLTESLVLSIIGGALGLAFAYWGVLALAKTNIIADDLRFQPSLLVLTASAGVTILTGILFGLAPALRATVGLSEAMKEGGSAGMGRTRFRLARSLIAGQVALSMALLACAGMFVRTLRNLQHIDLGFERENILIVDIDPSNLGYKDHRLRTFYDRVLEQARHIPGVRSAGLSAMTPLGEYARSRTFSAEGYQPKQGEFLMAYSNAVTDGYFTALGTALLQGRDFNERDEPAITPEGSFMAAIGRVSGGGNFTPANVSRVCIINEALARKLFEGANPLGRHLSFEDTYSPADAVEIVGVVKDVHHGGVKERDDFGIIYSPSWSDGAEARWLVVRTGGDATPVMEAIRSEVRSIDANVPVLRIRKMEEYVNASIRRERLIAYLSGFFGLLALVLASTGLYGVTSYAVTMRTREVGIRLALGAQRAGITGKVVRESLLPVVLGIAVGVAAALALTQLATGLLYGVAPRDPLSICVAAGALILVALVAALLPARRASRVEPAITLRHE